MKKLLLILALLAYIAISCDKPDTLTGGDEPETEQVDTDADTCKIYIRSNYSTFVYKLSSEDIDIPASVNSMFRHFTITLKDGSLATSIARNSIFSNESTFDSGRVEATKGYVYIDSLKYGNYLIVMAQDYWSTWGPNYSAPKMFFYHNVILDEYHTYDSCVFQERYIDSLVNLYDPLWFYKFYPQY